MRRLLRFSVAAPLAALSLVAAAGAAAAHSVKDAGNPGVAAPTTVPGPRLDAIDPVVSAAPASLALPWYLPVGVALGAAAVWRRPRRVVVVALVLVLAVFAFENALHSAHHGLDSEQREACTIAAAATHLAAVPVDGIAAASLILPAAGQAVEAAPAFARVRFPSPDQGRAPPSAIL
jgi:hypothetical protein